MATYGKPYGAMFREVRDKFIDWLYVNGFKYDRENTIYGTDIYVKATPERRKLVDAMWEKIQHCDEIEELICDF